MKKRNLRVYIYILNKSSKLLLFLELRLKRWKKAGINELSKKREDERFDYELFNND